MEAIIASVLGGLVSGLFTFLGVWLTIRHENQKTHREELKQQKEKEEQLFENRPRFEIMGQQNPAARIIAPLLCSASIMPSRRSSLMCRPTAFCPSPR